MHRTSSIDSDANPRFRSWRRQIERSPKPRAADLTLVAGEKIVREVLLGRADVVRYLLMPRASILGDLPEIPPHIEIVYLAPSLFRELDLFGTRSPLLLALPPILEVWDSIGPGESGIEHCPGGRSDRLGMPG